RAAPAVGTVRSVTLIAALEIHALPSLAVLAGLSHLRRGRLVAARLLSLARTLLAGLRLLLALLVAALLSRLPVLPVVLLSHRRHQVRHRVLDLGSKARIARRVRLLLACRVPRLRSGRRIAGLRVRCPLRRCLGLLLLLILAFAGPALRAVRLVLRVALLLVGDPFIDFRHVHRVEHAVG